MPLWSSLQQDYSEHAPLSAQDDYDDEEEPALPPYPANPKNGRSSNNGASHETMNTNGGYDDEEDDEDPGFGEGDFYQTGSGMSTQYPTIKQHKKQNNKPPTRHRTSLLCAYLKYCLCCCGAFGGGRTKQCLMCLFYMVLFVTIMVCAAGVGYIIARDGTYQKNNGDGNNNNAEVLNKPQQTNTAKLPPPPLDLHEICSDWITESGRQKCQSECSMADCCSLPANNKNSCWEEQADECATYRAACMALELHSDDNTSGGSSSSNGGGVMGPKTILYAPPSNLPILCSSEALATPGGFDNCANVCRPSRCCYPDNFDCNLADDRYCADYEDLCASVAESWRGSGHAVAPSSTTSGGGTTSSQNPVIANEVMKKCNAANLNPPDECIEACKPGACCYVSSSYLPIEQLFNEYYGAANNPMQNMASCASSFGFCQQYGSCEHLNHMKDVAGWHSDEVNYVVDVSTPCKAEHIAQFGALECSNVCQPAHCCFSGEYACDDVQLGHLNCDDYKACQVLYPNKKASTMELLQLAERIDEVCSDSSLKTIGGRTECQAICSDHSCCFGQDGCSDDGDKNCLAYAGCESYYDLPTGDGQVDTNSNNDNNNNNNNAGGGISMDMEVEEFVTALEETCSEENLKSINGIYKCHNKCQSHLCCFASDDDLAQRDCSYERPTACNVYEPCNKLVNPIHGNEPVKTLDSADIEKIVFDACYFGADPLKITEEMVQKCHGVCAQRLCCFSDYLLQSSCKATLGEDECELYSLCEQLVTDDGVEVNSAIDLQENEFDVAHLCTSKVNEDTDLYDACKGLCIEKRSCCFDKPGYSCYEEEQDWCDEYKACEKTNLKFSGGAITISNSNGGISANNASPLAPAEIEKTVFDACYFDNDESRVTQELVTKCHNVCRSRLCCFDSYKLQGSCRAAVGEDECELYSLCEQLINENGGEVKTFIELDLKEFDSDRPDISSSEQMIEKDVFDACYFGNDESRVTQELVTKCHNVCRSRLCCFDSYKLESSCRATVGEDECELYSLCEQLITADGDVVKTFIELDLKEFDDDTSNSNSASGPGSIAQFPSGNTGVNVGSEADPFVISLENACSESSLKTLGGLQTCHNKCQTHLCCFTTDSKLADQNCSGLIPAGCGAYEPCKKLVVPPAGTELVASPTALSTREETEKWVYDACYFGDDPTKVTEELVTKCHGVCAQRLCCFSDYLLQSSCRDTVGEDECELYSLCDQLVTQNGVASDALEVEEKEFGVDELCIDKVAIDTTLFSACRETCERRSCCFESNPTYSCYGLEKDWCDEYKACAVVEYNFYDEGST